MRKVIATSLACIKVTNLKRIIGRAEFTRGNRYNENYDSKDSKNVFCSTPTVQQSKVEMPTSICLIGGIPLEDHEMVVSNIETSVLSQLPKAKI